MTIGAVILGLLAGGGGALLGWLAAGPLLDVDRRLLAPALAVMFAGMGAHYGPAILGDAVGGGALDGGQAGVHVAQAMEQLAAEPLFTAIVKNDPDAQITIRDRLGKAYREGGIEGLEREGGAVLHSFGMAIFPSYLPRARDEDLVEFAEVVSHTADYLLERSAPLCYQWLLDSETLDYEAFNRLITADLGDRLDKVLNTVILNADEEPRPFDEDSAKSGLQMVFDDLFNHHDKALVQIIVGGARAQDDDQRAQACAFIRDLYRQAGAHDRAADILRLLLSG